MNFNQHHAGPNWTGKSHRTLAEAFGQHCSRILIPADGAKQDRELRIVGWLCTVGIAVLCAAVKLGWV